MSLSAGSVFGVRPRDPMTGRSLWYDLPDEVGLLEFPPAILAHFGRFMQTQPWHKEAGGQLFWEYAPNGYRRVGAITGPRPRDRRSRFGYKPDHIAEQQEIDKYYSQGLYFLGDWHTHPQKVAQPSPRDTKTILETYKRSTNAGPGFLMVIVGTSPLDIGLSVSWCNQTIRTILPKNSPVNTLG
jgi:integrative and conjugative element protein (TIGR02256 family)